VWCQGWKTHELPTVAWINGRSRSQTLIGKSVQLWDDRHILKQCATRFATT
jgi:hypothetical protein